MFVPAFLFEHTFAIAGVYLAFDRLLDGFNHSNIRTDLGMLRYVMVTPQSHRIHHSRDPRHFEKNFGGILSIWDHLFGTQYRVYDEYPEVAGVPYLEYPNDPVGPPSDIAGILKAVWLQLVYPFRIVFAPAVADQAMRLGESGTESTLAQR